MGVIFQMTADVASTSGGDVPRDAVSLAVSEEFDLFILRQPDAEKHFEFVGFAIEDADDEVVEFEEVFGVADDFILHEADALLDCFA